MKETGHMIYYDSQHLHVVSDLFAYGRGGRGQQASLAHRYTNYTVFTQHDWGKASMTASVYDSIVI